MNMIREFISEVIRLTVTIMNFTFSVKLMIFIKFLFGLYQKFETNKIFVQLAITYCIFINTIIPVYYLFTTPLEVDHFSAFCEHYILVFFSIYMKDEYLHDYINQMNYIDVKLGRKSVKVETVFLRIICLVIFIIIYLFFLNGLSSSSPSHICAKYINITQLVAFLPTIIMLELFRSKVSLLRNSIEFSFAHDTNFQEGTVTFKLKKIKKYIYIYKHLLDNILNRFPFIKFVVMVKLAGCFRRVMTMTYSILANFAYDHESDTGFLQRAFFYIFVNVTIMCVPLLLAELAANEVDKIKTILTDQLLTCRDAALRAGLEDALTYLRVRSFKVVVWRAIPVGVSTLLAFVALCTNYLIVLMQFMKS